MTRIEILKEDFRRLGIDVDSVIEKFGYLGLANWLEERVALLRHLASEPADG